MKIGLRVIDVKNVKGAYYTPTGIPLSAHKICLTDDKGGRWELLNNPVGLWCVNVAPGGDGGESMRAAMTRGSAIREEIEQVAGVQIGYCRRDGIGTTWA